MQIINKNDYYQYIEIFKLNDKIFFREENSPRLIHFLPPIFFFPLFPPDIRYSLNFN